MMDALGLIAKYKRSGALVDANILLVYAVGSFDKARLRAFPHTQQYADSYELIEQLINCFSVIYTTPHILTEVSNLGKKLGSGFFLTLQGLVSLYGEEHLDSKDVVKHPSFLTLGLTDAAILSIAASQYVVITADVALYQSLCYNNIDAVNVNHLLLQDWASAF